MRVDRTGRDAAPWLRALRAGLAITVGVLILFGYQVTRLYTDAQWFRETGRSDVFLTVLGVRLTLFFGFGLLFFLLFYFNIWLAGRISAPGTTTRYVDPEREVYAYVARVATRWLGIGGAVVLAFLAGGNATTHWSEYLQFTRSVPFGVRDPIFARDVGFYVFRLPFLSYLQGWLLFTFGASAAGALIIHYGERAADFMGGSLAALPAGVRQHLLGLFAVFAALWAWGHWLARYDILGANNGAFVGAGYTDVHARAPGQLIQTALMLLVSALCLANMRRGKPFALPMGGLAAWAAGSLIVAGLWPGFIQRFRVVPNQFSAEKAYIAHDIEFTRKAYGLDRVREQAIDGVDTLKREDLEQDAETIQNIRLWDWPQLGAVFEAKQALKTYYRFRLPAYASYTTGDFNIDVDRYALGGVNRQVMLAPREIYSDGIPTQARTWINLRLQYTHGYGAVMSPVNKVNSEGLPEYFMGQLPVETKWPELQLRRPEIYYGELPEGYVIVGTKQDELDYPSPKGNKLTRYAGKGGTRIGGAFNRLMWSVRLGDANMLLSSDLTPESKVLFRRNIRERVQTLAPFLNWDNDPYVVVHQGRLVWIMDGYTVTHRYPYARQTEVGMGAYAATQSFNYIRNSVKAVVDAYDGTVRLYAVDPEDPILRLWRRVFPRLVQSIDRMPAGLRSHLRYPEDLFRIQRDIYTIYHMSDPRAYYGKEDQWEVPSDPGAAAEDTDQTGARMTPYYINVRLPGSDTTEFLLMTPFTPLRTQNLSGWMCAKCDPEDYGELLVYRYPKGTNVNGPQQIMAQISSQEEISQTVTLLGQRGSRVSWGNLLAIPVGRSILYALPLYVQAAASTAARIPEVTQVVLATGDRIVMEPTLEKAVAALSSTGPASASPGLIADQQSAPIRATTRGAQPAVGDPLERARDAYERARAQQKAYDRILDELGAALEELKSRR